MTTSAEEPASGAARGVPAAGIADHAACAPSLGAGLRRPALWVAAAAFVGLAWGYLRSAPVFEAPDEPAHYQYAFHLATRGALPLVPGSAQALGRPAEDEQLQGYHPPLYYAWLALTAKLLGHGDTAATPWRNEQFGRFKDDPPGLRLMYRHGADETGSASPEVRMFRALRGWSVVFGLLTLLLIQRIGLVAAPSRPRVADAAVLVTACMPKWTFIFGVLNNDTLATLLAHAALLPLLALARAGSLAPRRALALGVVIGLAILAKLTALFLLPVLAAALLARLRAAPAERRAILAHGLLALLAAALVAGWYFGRNRLLYGSFMALDVHAQTFDAIRVRDGEAWNWIFGRCLPRLLQSFVGHFGWNILGPLPFMVSLLKGLVVAALIGWGLGLGRALLRRSGRPRPPLEPVAALLLAFAALLVLVLTLRYNLILKGPYARYLFPAMGPLALLLCGGLAALGDTLPRAVARPFAAVPFLAAPALGALVLISQFRPAFDPARAPAPAHYAILSERALADGPASGVTVLEPAAGAVLSREGGGFRLRFAAGAAETHFSLHVKDVDGRFVGMSYEQGGLAIAEGSTDLPAAVLEALPERRDLLVRVRAVADRSRGQRPAEMPASPWIPIRRK